MLTRAFAITLALSSPLLAQAPKDTGLKLTAKLPVDPKVRIATLPNGLRYYIRQNPKPEKRAELRLVVNAGSILESAKERGYAHFIEHTGFNGTKHFAKNDLVKYLQSIGVRFGADLNAYTSFDQTVYILPIPTDTARIVDQAFTILEDWAGGQSFDSTEVMAERGVVHEEWRLGKGAGERMLQQFLPIALKGSMYAERLPIGTEPSIMAATPSTLRPFYRRWYRPDLMSVVAVGDFDVKAIEAQIKKHFGGLPRVPNAPKRPNFSIPGNKTPLVAIASDKEAISTDVQVYFKRPRQSSTTVADFRRDLISQLAVRMLNGRFSEIVQKPDAPFTSASAFTGGFLARDLEPFALSAGVKDGGVERGLEALLVEARRVDQFGYLQSELDRTRATMLRSLEIAYAERDKTESSEFADEYVRNYLDQEAIPGIAFEYDAAKRLLPTIMLEDVNKLASSWITDENRVVIARAPIKDNVALPTEAGILSVFDRASKALVVAYTESLSGDALIETLRPAGRIVASRAMSAGVTEWKLSNGARVLVKPTDFKADEIVFGAFSPGGTSLAPDSSYMSAVLAPQIVNLGGVGKFNRIDLNKKLAGKAARVTPTIGEMTEGLNGSASPRDLETMLQLVYLDFTAPRLDSTAFDAFKASITPMLTNRGSSPDMVFADTVTWTLGQHSFRSRPVTPATFAEVKPEKAVNFYRERFASASDFTFVFVGTIDTLALKPLVEKYLASLPGSGKTDTARVVTLGPPKGIVQATVRKGVENKATTLMMFTGPCTFSMDTRVTMRALTEVLQMRVIDLLREKLGGAYSPSVGGGCNRTPRQEYTVQVYYGSSPENVEGLSAAVLALADTLKNQGPTQADVDKAKEAIIRSHEVELKQNSYWLSIITQRDQAGEDYANVLAPMDQLVRAITVNQVRDAARQYLNPSNYARFILLPEPKTTP